MHDHRTYFQEMTPDAAFSDVFHEFVETFPEEYRTKSMMFYNNAIHSATRVRHYFLSLKIALGRYNVSSRQLRAIQLPFIESLKENFTVPEYTNDQHAHLNRMKDQLSPIFMLDYESFFLIAKIVLDRVANFIEYVFGPTPLLALDTHDHLVKHISPYATERGISLPDSLTASLAKMKQSISDYSEYDICQQKSPKAVLSTGFDSEGIARISINFIYPTESETQKQGVDPNHLFAEIDHYVHEIFKMVIDHRSQYLVTDRR